MRVCIQCQSEKIDGLPCGVCGTPDAQECAYEFDAEDLPCAYCGKTAEELGLASQYSSLVWHLMPQHGGPQPKTTTCLFSDGYAEHRLGWWSRSEQTLYVPNADGTNGTIDHGRFKWWAQLSNLKGFQTAEAIKGVESLKVEADRFDDEDGCDGEDRPWCDRCNNLGVIICHCGGDLCVCENQGEYPCPDCS